MNKIPPVFAGGSCLLGFGRRAGSVTPNELPNIFRFRLDVGWSHRNRNLEGWGRDTATPSRSRAAKGKNSAGKVEGGRAAGALTRTLPTLSDVLEWKPTPIARHHQRRIRKQFGVGSYCGVGTGPGRTLNQSDRHPKLILKRDRSFRIYRDRSQRPNHH